MKIRVLNYFLVVAKEESITRATKILHITQPTLSRQLTQMENELGVKLFNHGRKLTLTEDGILLRRRAEQILALVDQTQHEIADSNEGIKGVIRICCAETMAIEPLTVMIEAFRKQYPSVLFKIHSGNADHAKAQIDAGVVDMGLLLEPVDILEYRYCRLSSVERWGLLVSADDPLAEQKQIEGKTLYDLPLLMSNRKEVNQEIARRLDVDVKALNIVVSYDLLLNAAYMVKQHVGYAVTIEGATALLDKTQFRFVPLSPAIESRTCLAWKKYYGFGKAMAKFLEFISAEPV